MRIKNQVTDHIIFFGIHSDMLHEDDGAVWNDALRIPYKYGSELKIPEENGYELSCFVLLHIRSNAQQFSAVNYFRMLLVLLICTRSPYITFSTNCTSAQQNPRILGSQM